MTAVNINELDAAASGVEGLDSTKGSGPDTIFRYAAFAAGLLVLVILALITFTTAQAAWPAFSRCISSRTAWSRPTGDATPMGSAATRAVTRLPSARCSSSARIRSPIA